MGFIPGIGPLWLEAIIVGSLFLVVAAAAAALAFGPTAIQSRATLGLYLSIGFGISGATLIGVGAFLRFEKRRR